MNYDAYSYLYPPRPEKKIPRDLLSFYKNRGYWAQVKKNGTCTVIFARGSEVIFKTRHPDENDGNHTLWTPQPEHTRFFSGNKRWSVFVAELLHSKVTGGPKNQLYIFDQIVHDGCHLVGETFAHRQERLHALWSGSMEPHQVRINERITVARCFDTSFMKLFDDLGAEDEGLVLKDPKAMLQPCFRENNNTPWQVKCRLPHKNYSF